MLSAGALNYGIVLDRESANGSIGLVAVWEKYGWPDLLPDPRKATT